MSRFRRVFSNKITRASIAASSLGAACSTTLLATAYLGFTLAESVTSLPIDASRHVRVRRDVAHAHDGLSSHHHHGHDHTYGGDTDAGFWVLVSLVILFVIFGLLACFTYR